MTKTAAEVRPAPSLDEPLTKHIAWILWARRNGGAHCPTCGQLCQDRPRSITNQMARALEMMYRKGGTTRWVKRTSLLRRVGQRGGDDAKLALWDLIETPTADDPSPDGKFSGWARVTEKGEQFILGDISIPRVAWVFNRELLEFEGPDILFADCWAEPIDLQEILERHHGGGATDKVT